LAKVLNFFYNFFLLYSAASGDAVNLPPVFTQDMNNLALSEVTPLNSIVYTLEGFDPEGGNVTFGLIGSDNFEVNPTTGDVKLIKGLDREVIYFLIFWFIYATP
jgi:hypothetical protein